MNRESKGVKRTATTVRILLALTFFVLGGMYFFTPADKIPTDLATPAGAFMAAMLAAGYFLPFVKAVEVIGGFMLFSKRWSALGLLVLTPVIVNIFLFNTLLAPVSPSGVIMSSVIAIFAAYLAAFNWPKYESLFRK